MSFGKLSPAPPQQPWPVTQSAWENVLYPQVLSSEKHFFFILREKCIFAIKWKDHNTIGRDRSDILITELACLDPVSSEAICTPTTALSDKLPVALVPNCNSSKCTGQQKGRDHLSHYFEMCLLCTDNVNELMTGYLITPNSQFGDFDSKNSMHPFCVSNVSLDGYAVIR